MSEEWTLEELEAHIKLNLTHNYNTAIVISALFLKLYDRLPKIGLSGFQASGAEFINECIPNSQQTIMASNQIGKMSLFNLERENERYKNIIFEISKIIEAEKGR